MEKRDIVKTYRKLIRTAFFFYKTKQWESALSQLEIAAHIMYKYSFFFCDAQADQMLKRIGREVLGTQEIRRKEKVVMIYDSYGQDRRGLIMIYVRALCKAGNRVIYLVNNKNAKSYRETAEIVQQNGGSIIPVLMDGRVQRMHRIAELVALYAPSCIFMEVLPWDSAVLAAFTAFGHVIPRFYINITDHLYWLGRYSFDRCIEFRPFGYGLSKIERRIPEKHLARLPYYPFCTHTDKEVQLDRRLQGRRYIYSGGTLDKIKGSDKFWQLCEYILENHPDVGILYTGNGDSEPIRQFIAEHHCEDRFIYERERPDFEQLIAHCVFFLNTYPVAGGLMSQYAASYGKIPVTFTDYVSGITDLFVDGEKAKRFIFTDMDQICNYISLLLDDADYLKEEESHLGGLIISEEDFCEQLALIMRGKPGEISFSYSKEDLEGFAEQVKQAYQLSGREFDKLLFEGNKARFLFPLSYCRYLAEGAKQKD